MVSFLFCYLVPIIVIVLVFIWFARYIQQSIDCLHDHLKYENQKLEHRVILLEEEIIGLKNIIEKP